MNALPTRRDGPAAVDWLALERTELANERTLLAWLRTGLGLAAAGATLIRFGSGAPSDVCLGGFGILTGGVLGAVGILRFVVAARRYRRWRRAWTAMTPSQNPSNPESP
jgi:putative membrane protein